MPETAGPPDAYSMRALRAARAIAWDYDLRSRLVAHYAAAEVFRIAPLPSPITLKSALRFVHREDRHGFVTRARMAVRHREPFVHHFRLMLPRAGDPLSVESQAEVTFDKEGRPAALAGTLIDITAHRRALDALETADRRKDEFIATVAHELQSPLSAIGVATQLLKSNEIDATRLSACVDMIRRQATHLSRLVDDLLDMSRAIRDRLELRQESVELRAAITAAIETAGSLISSRHQNLRTNLPPQPVHVQGDSVRLAQVFGNLLTNAAKYTPQGGDLEISLEPDATSVIVRVRDSGIGIAPEELPHLFEPFYRSNAARSSAAGGLGIGLALVQRIVRLHGGSIEARSAGLGRGSEFILRLPKKAEWPLARPTEGVTSGSALSTGHPLRVLIADDNEDVAEAFALGLRMCGHEVAVAYDGEEALQIADHFRPQVALLDLTMPKRPGHLVAAELRNRPWARERGIRIVALTGWKPSGPHGRVDSNAFDAQIMKPAELSAVNRLVNAYWSDLASPQSRAESANDA